MKKAVNGKVLSNAAIQFIHAFKTQLLIYHFMHVKMHLHHHHHHCTYSQQIIKYYQTYFSILKYMPAYRLYTDSIGMHRITQIKWRKIDEKSISHIFKRVDELIMCVIKCVIQNVVETKHHHVASTLLLNVFFCQFYLRAQQHIKLRACCNRVSSLLLYM